jgi:hypothetical protein
VPGDLDLPFPLSEWILTFGTVTLVETPSCLIAPSIARVHPPDGETESLRPYFNHGILSEGRNTTLFPQQDEMRLVTIYDVVNDESFLVELLAGQLTLDALEGSLRDRGK